MFMLYMTQCLTNIEILFKNNFTLPNKYTQIDEKYSKIVGKLHGVQYTWARKSMHNRISPDFL